MKISISLVAAMLPLISFAQNAYEYQGEKVALEAHYFQSSNMGKLQGDKKQTYQGMDIYNGYVVSAQNTGIVTVYRIDGSSLNKSKQFKLASYGKENHANTISFGTEKASDDAILPVIYVSQCSKDKKDGMSNVAFVEQIEKNLKSSKLVQTIYYDGAEGRPLQWVVDRENRFLYAYTSTAKWDAKGKHQIIKFQLPKLSDGENGIVKLSTKDAIETYCIEDTYQAEFNAVVQGVYINDGLLFIPAGDGTVKNPSVLYVWDLASHSMRNVIDMSSATRGELEDCSSYDGNFYIQTQGQFYKIIF